MTSKADRLRKIAPGADEILIESLAGRSAAEVDAIVRLARQAGKDALAADVIKRRNRRESRRHVDEDRHTAAGLRIIDATAKRAQRNPEALAGLAAYVRAINLVLRLAVDGLREQGYSDQDIANALDVSQQAVTKRWPRQLDGSQPGL